MHLTAELKLPYPDPDESVDPARDIRALAEAIDTAASGWFPIGGIISHDETQVPPAGWLPCDGRAFTAAQYPVLAALLPGLKLPDLNGRSLVGASANPGYALHSVAGWQRLRSPPTRCRTTHMGSADSVLVVVSRTTGTP